MRRPKSSTDSIPHQQRQYLGCPIRSNGRADLLTVETVRNRDLTVETSFELGLINCEDLDEALKWAARVPAAKEACVVVLPLTPV
jgi:hypothetical protein